MRWIKVAAGSRRGALASALAGFCSMALLVSVVLLHADEKHLTVFSPQQYYSLNLVDIGGQDYVDLASYLEGLGRVEGKLDAKQWKFRFINPAGDSVELQFENNKSKFKIRGKTLEMGQSFHIQDGRPYAPPHVLPELTTQLLHTQVEYHPSGRRLFIGPAAITFSTELQKQPTPRLVLHFSAPVNPSVTTEHGKVRLVFSREPVNAPPGTQNLGDASLSSSTFSENNGTAELAIAGNSQLVANFSDGGRTITVSTVPQVAAAPTPPAPQAPAAPATPPAPATPVQAAPAAAQRPRFLIVIDPAHGGAEKGAVFGEKLVEKDLTLAWARQLRNALDKLGVTSVLLREGDSDLSADQRAGAANGARPAAFISLHVGNSGTGVRLYTARLPAGPAKSGSLIPWNSAQSGFLVASRELSEAVNDALDKRDIPSAASSAMLRPLNNVTAPAIAVEVMPSNGDLATLSAPLYQQSVCSALAEALAGLRKPEAAQ